MFPLWFDPNAWDPSQMLQVVLDHEIQEINFFGPAFWALLLPVLICFGLFVLTTLRRPLVLAALSGAALFVLVLGLAWMAVG